LDLATVTHDHTSIAEIARRTLHVEPLATHRLALVDAGLGSWARDFKRLPQNRVSPAAFTSFPLILPEADAGIRKAIDRVLQREGILRDVNVPLELGGWSAILAYVRDGHGVGLVSEAVLTEVSDLNVRYLDPDCFPPTVTKIVCRQSRGPEELLDLSPDAEAWRQTLHELSKQRRIAKNSP
jgi:DNA-binding transcriptional LysR family regulator